MSTKQCEEKLKDKGVRPTAARILILQKLSEQTYPISLLELEAQLETLDKSTISRSLAILLEHHAIHAFEDGSGSMKYEICRSDTETCFIENRHIHFYCEVCHKTYCMDHIKIPVVQLPEGFTLEVTRLCTNGAKNACSFLYGAAARAAAAMGYKRIITYTLESENGASLRASGWICQGKAGGLRWTGKRQPKEDQYPAQMKLRYEKQLRKEETVNGICSGPEGS